MNEMHLGAGFRWQRHGRLRLRPLTRADLASLAGAGMGRSSARTQTLETWPKAAIVEALIRHSPDLQVAVELDQRVVGGLLACPQLTAPKPVMQPWTLRDSATLPGDGLSDLRGGLMGDEIGASAQALRGVGAVWLGGGDGPQVQEALRLGRPLMVQQGGCEATFSVVRAAGWQGSTKWGGRLSAQAYLQQVHARSIEDVRLGAYLDAGYMMRGYWRVGEAIEVLMRWAYRAH